MKRAKKTPRKRPSPPRPAPPRADGTSVEAGLEALRTGEPRDLEAAADRLRRALELSPADVGLARLLGEVLEATGERKEALSVLERVAKHAPRDADLLVELGYARLTVGDAPAARRAFERALSLRPKDALIRRPLAQIYESLGKTGLAAETLAAVPRETASPRLLGDLARLYLSLDRHREAEQVFRALATADPEHALLAQHGSTWCLIKLGDWRGALEVALEATRLDRFDLTTAFLAYAKDRLFTRVPDAGRRESELSERFLAELREHDEAHSGDEGGAAAGTGMEEVVGG
jgi:tetratricopeptide (TPR) repeat protein